MGQYGEQKESIRVVNELVENNPRNLYALDAVALLSREINDPTAEIQARKSISRLDPWNAKNYLELGRDYKLIGEFTEMERCKKIILEFAANTPEASIALTELVS